jgi:hypothetical protein
LTYKDTQIARNTPNYQDKHIFFWEDLRRKNQPGVLGMFLLINTAICIANCQKPQLSPGWHLLYSTTPGLARILPPFKGGW